MEWSAFDPAAFKAQYERDGYAVVRAVFTPAEVAAMKARFDAWRTSMLEKHHATFVCGNHRVWLTEGGAGGAGATKRVLRGIQWPSYTDPTLDAFRTDARLFAIASALIGADIKQIINQCHWKQPGSTTSWRLHQDVRARKPDAAYRELWSSFINTGIALERFDEETGAFAVLPGSHAARRDLGLEAIAEAMGLDDGGRTPTREEEVELLRRAGQQHAQLRTLALAPGDVGVWHPFAIHGGGVNTSADCHRSFYINGYVTAQNCDRGHVAWLGGVPQPLGEPVLIQLDNFRETLAEGGRYYAAGAGAGGSKLDDALRAEAEAKLREAAAMNVVRD
jgi:ectoine hydroxylase-related dioxygenase (phytanoyl-CoA dioxygenase family)